MKENLLVLSQAIIVVIDFLMIIFFLYLYFKLRKFLTLPWDKIIEGIEKANRLVNQLERLKEGSEGAGNFHEKGIKEKVLALYKKGLSQREIARTLKISEGEVELILSAQKFKKR